MKTQFINHNFFILTLVIVLIVFGVQGISYGQDLNVGEPRTVRMIYFLPNDLPYRADVVQKMKDVIHTVQNFYAEQMQAHGYGNKTFQFETEDQGEPKVHRVNGKHPFSYYDNTLGNAVIAELEQTFDLDANIYFIVLGADALRQGNGLPAGGVANQRGKNGGTVLVPNGFGRFTVAHELGHTFGLVHDFRDNSYIMSYGHRQDVSLSACAAEFLTVSPHINPRIPITEGQSPTIELISSPTYPAGSKSIPVRLKIKDSEGIHQVQLLAWGGLQDCRRLAEKKDAVVEFEYSGGIGLLDFDASLVDFTSLSDATVHNISIKAVDTDGNVGTAYFQLAEMSPLFITDLGGRHTDVVRSLAFSPDGQILASGSFDNTVKLWNIAAGTNIATFKHTRPVNTVRFSSDGQTLASGGDDGIHLWDMTTRKIITTLDHEVTYYSVSFSPDGQTLAAASSRWSDLQLWDLTTERSIDMQIHEGNRPDYPRSVSFSSDGQTLASGSWYGEVKLWDVAAKRNIATLDTGAGKDSIYAYPVHSMSFSPDGQTLATGGSADGSGEVKLWDVAAKRNIATLKTDWEVLSVSFSPDGQTLATAEGSALVKLWDIATASEIVDLPHTSPVYSVAFSPNGTTLASGTSDGTIKLWDVTSSALRKIVDNRPKITISEIMVASNGGRLPQWIELYNRSQTHPVNLKGWTLEIQNYRSENFNGDQNLTITFKEKSIGPNKTLLIVSKQGRASKQFRDEQIYNLNTLHPNLQDTVLSEEGFYMKLSNTAGKLIDEVGNLDGKKNTNDKPAWRLPTGITKDGARSSMIRRQNEVTPLFGTKASGWITAKNTKLADKTTHYYGHPHDIGAPGVGSGEALPVTLSRFRADRTKAGVILKWTTESEVDNAGFNILRGEKRNGTFKVINSKMIQGAGTTGERNSYTWKDTTAKPNTVYYYRIEDVSHAGVRQQLATVRLRGLVSASGKLITSWGDVKMQE
ncbi:MAG: lamin tail domain-containing protein [Candidatus Poribacteria bacterium]|nr:lamin tail domain-containing protein [Candidatus Poribacteria bacterium]